MRFLIAPDSFKNCMNSIEVGACIAKGLLKVYPQAQISTIPMADGGEGTVEAILHGIGGQWVEMEVMDALMRPRIAKYGISTDKTTAIIEMAQASGIEHLGKEELNPLTSTTFGTGQLIKNAIDKGCKHIIMGIGGSATNDGGMGMARALGYAFYNKKGQEVKDGGGNLNEIHRIDASKRDKRIDQLKIEVACDVNNPFYGPQGASVVYGPQKGASPENVAVLDKNLMHFSNLIAKQLNTKIAELPGAGAAGGLGGGLVAFANASLVPGFNLIAQLTQLEKHIAKTDIVITAEGSIDHQTLFGKTPAGIGLMAKKYNKAVFVFGGAVADNIGPYQNSGISGVLPICQKPSTLEEAIKNASKWLPKAAENFAKALKTGQQLKI